MKIETEKKLKNINHISKWPGTLIDICSLLLVVVIIFQPALMVEEEYAANELTRIALVADVVAEHLNMEYEKGMTDQELWERYTEKYGDEQTVCIIQKNGTLIGRGDETIDAKSDFIIRDVRFFVDAAFVDYHQKVTDGKSGGKLDEDSLYKMIEQLEKESGSKGHVVLPVWCEAANTVNGGIVAVKNNLELETRGLNLSIKVAKAIAILMVAFLTLREIDKILKYIGRKQLTHLLYVDPVTGGHNWVWFQRQTSKLLCQTRNADKTYAIVDFTLMKYRSYCTLHGMKKGEELLAQIDKVLRENMGPGELCARYAKSNFALLLYTKEDDIQEIPKRVDELVHRICGDVIPKRRPVVLTKEKYRTPEHTLYTFHAGVYLLYPLKDKLGMVRRRQYIDVDQMYNNAGIARNVAAHEEGNRVIFFDDKMWEEQLWEHKVEDQMQGALEREEFEVYLQPKYNPVTEELSGAEALVRWNSPTEGFISPGRFIPIFEKTGFVTKLDDYMISHVAKLQAKWLAEGKKIVPVSVNVSREHFAQSNLAEQICGLVDVYGVPHQYIEIELTESAFFDDKDAMLTTIRRLQHYGFDVSMDDFGAGYSSLNSLKDLPLNVLKLDADFFRGGDEDHRGEIVVSEAIALAKKLNMRIVAEGVEKEEQVAFLAKQECDMIQGYYYAKPMPAGEYELRMEKA